MSHAYLFGRNEVISKDKLSYQTATFLHWLQWEFNKKSLFWEKRKIQVSCEAHDTL